MNTAARLAGFGGALVLLAAGGFAVGNTAGPVSAATTEHRDPGGEHAGMAAPAGELPGGLASSQDGYTFTAGPAPEPGRFSFTITGPDGKPVTAFDVEHEKRLHLIVVRRDTSGFRHVHPELAPDGTWSVPLTLPAAGSYRAFADFAPTGGKAMTLGVDLSVAGAYQPATYEPSRTAQVDGYTVELAGELTAGKTSPLTLTVRRGGVPVTDLQPYLAAYGHLVALREGDLAYLHVHPDGAPGDGRTAAGPQVKFAAEVPSAGTYRLFLDFKHGDVVRTAEFTVTTREGGRS
ncbi:MULTISPECIES: hypothetical protein [unclassified Amycolatopsis]|uniref:hypothetical protein n=1 Tax=unclassified Amycolatopsis TaxID=2618356 RepID=UPI002875A310|nr:MULTISPECIES: hypothetical protein [unclassified Amycolatopsis]MDS0136141.1 hypothetical protein [Amycolatopsis sp. 505]MDS0145270.1 hypothetical protein [Amycolatopsis sp. CM201R]